MKAVIQKVSSAETIVDGELVSSIKKGVVIFLGIAIDDDESDIDWLINKITKLRIFNTFDNNINDVKGEVLLISQFTLQANVLKGNRPSFIKAAKPDLAKTMYDSFLYKFSIFLINSRAELFSASKAPLKNSSLEAINGLN